MHAMYMVHVDELLGYSGISGYITGWEPLLQLGNASYHLLSAPTTNFMVPQQQLYAQLVVNILSAITWSDFYCALLD